MTPEEFSTLLQNQIIVLDGAMGTMIQNLNLPETAYGGPDFTMLGDLIAFSRPDDLKNLHMEYLKAGANAIETNTFGASPLRLQEFDFSRLDCSDFQPQEDGADLTKISLEDFCYRMNKNAAMAAKNAVEAFRKHAEYDGRPLLVFGSIGPSNWVLSSTNADLHKGTYEQIVANFYHQVLGLIDGGVDVLLFETQQDMLELKVAVFGAKKAMEEKGVFLPIVCQVTVDQFSRMQIFHTDIVAALVTLQDIGIDAFGINCSIGPDLMEPTVKKLSAHSRIPISIVPNAGLPVAEGGKTVFKLLPEEMADYVKTFVEKYGVNIVGGCCGTTPEHIRAVADAVRGLKPRPRKVNQTTYISGPQNAVALDGQKNLIRIGERLNVRGSKKVRDAVEVAEQIDQNALEEVVNEQVRDLGLEIIDVCMDSNQVDTKSTLVNVIRSQTVDFQGAMSIDSFDVGALEEAIKIYPGKPIVNSISLEEYTEGQDKIDAVLKVTRKHAPVYICLATGPNGPGATAEEKYQLAKAIVEKTTQQYGIRHEQLMIDINAFPIGSESVPGMNFAMESIKALPMIKALHPDLKTTIGVGNLTNGLAKKPYMRVVLTSVFLDEARKEGLDAAIVNSNHYVPVESLDANDYQLGLRVILKGDMEAFEELEMIAERKKGVNIVKKTNYDDLSDIDAICEKIKAGFKERSKGELIYENQTYTYADKIVAQTARVLKDIPPLTLINEYLMKSMQELGDDFAEGKVSLPHLLKSADVMKQVMGFLEDYMKKSSGKEQSGEIEYKGVIVLGTVYQDVHSIGKDLAKTLLENYGYKVIDLGVQVPLERFVEAAQEYKADVVGMSALLVQTSNHMIRVAAMMDEAGLENTTIMIGGAPVNHRHAAYVAMGDKTDTEMIRANVFYCASAMDGVNYLNSLQEPSYAKDLLEKNRLNLLNHLQRGQRLEKDHEKLLQELPRRIIHFGSHHPKVSQLPDIQVVRSSMKEFESCLKKELLFTLNWKFGGKGSWEKKGIDEAMLLEKLLYWIEKVDREQWLKPQGVFGVFPCRSENSEVLVYDQNDSSKILGKFHFNLVIGKGKKDIFSVADYFRSDGEMDLIGLQVSTGGAEVEAAIEELKKTDQESALYLQGLSDRVAEDMAQHLNEKMVKALDSSRKLLSARYSPGYPAMKEIENNFLIGKLLDIETNIGVKLTEAAEFQPTGTTGAVVCFHKDAGYK